MRTLGEVRLVIFLLLGSFYVGHLMAQQPPDQKPPDAQQLQSTITQLVQMLNESRETQQAQAAALVAKSQQIQALQQGIGPACIASVERANPGKTLDATTFAIKDKPKAGDK